MKKIIGMLLTMILLVTAQSGLGEETWVCGTCGSENSGMFCTQCGAARYWICPECDTENTGNFCGSCGAAKPEKAEIETAEPAEEEAATAEPAHELHLDWLFIDSVAIDGSDLVIYLKSDYSKTPDLMSIRREAFGFASGVIKSYSGIERVILKYGARELLSVDFDVVVGLVKDGADAVTQICADIGNAVGGAFRDVKNGVVDSCDKAIDGLRGMLDDAAEAIESIAGGVGARAEDVYADVASFAEGAAEDVGDLVTDIIEAIRKLFG